MAPDRHFDCTGDPDRHEALLEVVDFVVRSSTPTELFQGLGRCLHKLFQFEVAGVSMYDPARNALSLQVWHKGNANSPMDLPLEDTTAGWVLQNQQPLVFADAQPETRFLPCSKYLKRNGIRSFCEVPLTTPRRRVGTLALGSSAADLYNEKEMQLLRRVADVLALAVENATTGTAFHQEKGRLDALMVMSDLLVGHHEIAGLLPALVERLHRVIGFELLVFSLYDPTRKLMRARMLELGRLSPEFRELPPDEVPAGLAWKEQRPVTMPEVAKDNRFPQAVKVLLSKGMLSYCALPLTTANRRIGSLGFGSLQQRTFTDGDLSFFGSIAKLVALAAENAMVHTAFHQEKDRLDALLKISTELLSSLQVNELFPAIAELVRRVVEQDFASLAVYDEHSRCLTLHPLDSQLAAEAIGPDATVPVTRFPFGRTFLHGEAKFYDLQEISSKEHPLMNRMLQIGIKSLCSVPMITRKGTIGTLNLGSLKENAFGPQDIGFLTQVANQVAVALENAAAYQEIAELTDKLKKENIHLRDEIRSTLDFEEIIGNSPILQRALAQVETVAPTNATALILGETGTGKELIARAIHRMSARCDASFIKLNCAAIPTGLLESELFGHERGAFTGAVSQKVGRLELADKGTLFLDEVGDIPLELQPKLLRVLQDQEFERLGGNRTIRVNLRLVAATNRDLAKLVAAGEFRSDLYYRLHVFPVRMPPLRERPTDIPMLVRHFVQISACRLNRQIDTIPARTMDALVRWRWPGNVRELENFMERSVLLSEGPVLNAPLAELCTGDEGIEPNSTLLTMEREHILRILRETGGVIAGVHGAATRLGMKRTTLQSKIQRLAIQRGEYEGSGTSG